MSDSTAEQILPKLFKLASGDSNSQNNFLLKDSSGLSTLANASSLVEQQQQQLDNSKLSHINIESLEAILRTAASKRLMNVKKEGSVSSSSVDQRSHSTSPTVLTVTGIPNSHSNAPQGGNQTAVISLQASQSDSKATATALLASEDFQHLLNRSPMGDPKTTENGQFYLLVPSDVPVIVPSSTAAQGNSSLLEHQHKPPEASWPKARRNSTIHPATPQSQWTGSASLAAYLSQQRDECSPLDSSARRASVIGTVHERLAAAAVENQPEETRNIRRRVSHNEVERRRRDRINTWIGELQKMLPADEQAKSHYQSKGLVLKRVWEYSQTREAMLVQLEQENRQLKLRMGQMKLRLEEMQHKQENPRKRRLSESERPSV